MRAPGLIAHDPAPPAQRHLEDLRFAEQFFVWALRAWVHNSQSSSDKAVAIETGFKLAKIEPALATLTFFMRVLQNAALRPIEIRCIHCALVSPDEELLIHAVGALQAGRHVCAQIVLHHYLPCAAVRATMANLEMFAERLRRGSLVLELNDQGRAHVESLCDGRRSTIDGDSLRSPNCSLSLTSRSSAYAGYLGGRHANIAKAA